MSGQRMPSSRKKVSIGPSTHRMIPALTCLVARMRAVKEGAVAGQNRLVTKNASLWTENERLRWKLAVGNYKSLSVRSI